MKKVFLFFVVLMFAQVSHALVDAKNANFSDTWIDIDIPGTPYPLKVSRAYNSRSLFNGIFGFGWCSDLETQLEATAEGTIRLKECGDGAVFNYRQRDFSKDEVEEAVANIIAAVKKETPSLNGAALKKLQSELGLSRDERDKYAAKYKIEKPIKEGTRYFADGRENEAIVKDKTGFTRTLTDGSLQKFNFEGNLVANFDRGGSFLKYVYQNGLVREIIDSQARKLTFEYYPNKKVKSITGPNKISAQYKYAGLNDLASAKSGDGTLYSYEYDELHNLIRIGFPDKTFKKLTYDKNKDWVTSFRERDGCIETYDWTLSKEDPKNRYASNVEKTCNGKIVNKSKFDFWFKPRPDGDGKFLFKTTSTVNGSVIETTMHPQYNRPVEVVQNGVKTIIEYYNTGLVKSRTTGKLVTSFKYDDATKKVIEVKTGDRTTSFKYDKAGNLTSAHSSDGLAVSLLYDDKGRIIALTDQAKRVVNIAYEEKFGKPKSVERPGVGSIEVLYKLNGEIKEVKSKRGGPTVAVQVASTFNSLLELVAPAGVDIGI